MSSLTAIETPSTQNNPSIAFWSILLTDTQTDTIDRITHSHADGNTILLHYNNILQIHLSGRKCHHSFVHGLFINFHSEEGYYVFSYNRSYVRLTQKVVKGFGPTLQGEQTSGQLENDRKLCIPARGRLLTAYCFTRVQNYTA